MLLLGFANPMSQPFKKSPIQAVRLYLTLLGMLLTLGLSWGQADETAIWQVTLEYDEAGSWELVEAEIAEAAKEGSLTAGGHAVVTDWEWLDLAGDTILETVAHLPLQVCVPMAEVGPGVGGWVLPERGFVTTRVLGPKREEEVASVRVMASGSRRSLPVLGNMQVLTLPEERVELFAEEETGPIGSYLLHDTGEDSKRLVLVIVGDGYLKEDIESGLYREHAERTLSAFEDRSPWDILLKGTNVHVIDVVSTESGASKEDGADGTIKDTYFQAAFHQSGIERLLFPQGDGHRLARQAADEAVGVGAWDQIIMMVNSTKYGGSGGSIAVHSMNINGPKISVHEVGHSYAGLADEYDYGNNETWGGSRPGEVNVDTELNDLKWKNWLDEDAPIPTPDLSAWNGYVGAFEGAKYKELGVYRPERACMMRELNDDFCRVCVERHIQRYFELLPFSNSAKSSLGLRGKLMQDATYRVEQPSISGTQIQWFLNEEALDGETEPSLRLERDDLIQGANDLRVELRYDEALVRSGLPYSEFNWGLSLFEIPADWLEQYGLATDDLSGVLDHDGDGFSAAEEYVAGTSPVDTNSYLQIVPRRSFVRDELESLHWREYSDRSYRLERSKDLVNWETVSVGDGVLVHAPVIRLRTYYLSDGERDCFFRIRVKPLF